MEADARRLKEIEDALKRINAKTIDLRKKRKDAQNKLYDSMIKNGVDSYEGYTVKKIAPRPKAKRKPAKAKKQDALKLFAKIGVDDPNVLWEEFEKTQKIVENTSESEEIF
jgi:hypothetical protein